jgi:hypothetical protein
MEGRSGIGLGARWHLRGMLSPVLEDGQVFPRRDRRSRALWQLRQLGKPELGDVVDSPILKRKRVRCFSLPNLVLEELSPPMLKITEHVKVQDGITKCWVNRFRACLERLDSQELMESKV